MRQLYSSILLFFLVACTSTVTPSPTSTIVPTATSANTPTPEPASTPTITPTATSTPLPLVDLEGTLFFDYNGSGLREDNEPPITGFGVCAKAQSQEEVCVDTDENGHFVFEELAPADTQVHLSLIDPNVDNPSLAFRYINLWRESVVVPAYELNGAQVPEQHLNDTELIPLDSGIDLATWESPQLGLMQGFLTGPYSCDVWHEIIGYFDHLRDQPGVLRYDGDTRETFDPYVERGGVGNEHNGIDWEAPHSSPVLAMAPGEVEYVGTPETALLVRINHGQLIPFMPGWDVVTIYGHLDRAEWGDFKYRERVIPVDRGQIIGLTGSSGTSRTHLHVTVGLNKSGTGFEVKGPFGVTYQSDDSLELLNLWTVHNAVVCQ